MEAELNVSKRVETYIKTLEGVLRGSVIINGINVVFNPSLESSRIESKQIEALKKYVTPNKLTDKRGPIFSPEGEFSLKASPETLALYLLDKEKKGWSQAMVIYLFDRSIPNNIQTDVINILSSNNELSSFVYGRFRERKEQEHYTIIRRYYLE